MWEKVIDFSEFVSIPFFDMYTVQSVKSIDQYFRLFEYSNNRPGNFTFYRGIHEFSNPSIFDKITFSGQ